MCYNVFVVVCLGCIGVKPRSSGSARHQAARKKHLASSGLSAVNMNRSKRQIDLSERSPQINRLRSPRREKPGVFKKIVGGLAIASIRISAVVLRSAVQLGRKKIAGQPVWLMSAVALCLSFLIGTGLGMIRAGLGRSPDTSAQSIAYSEGGLNSNGRPHISPLPTAKEVWTCDVAVIGGSLGGVAAASHAMQSGATTCLIEQRLGWGGRLAHRESRRWMNLRKCERAKPCLKAGCTLSAYLPSRP